jgi:hypothetical protein
VSSPWRSGDDCQLARRHTCRNASSGRRHHRHRRLEGQQCYGSKFTRGDQRTATPFEPFACQLSEEQVGHQASVATIAVGVNVDCDEAMMIAGRISAAGRPNAQSVLVCRLASDGGGYGFQAIARRYSCLSDGAFRPTSRSCRTWGGVWCERIGPRADRRVDG